MRLAWPNAMIRLCTAIDFEAIYAVINDAARAYEGVIPADVWKEPYMPRDELQNEIAAGVRFWGFEGGGELLGVMGIQHVGDATLLRHAYVRGASQRQGIGGDLLAHLHRLTDQPMLVGTWADASWAIQFYQDRGFRLVTPDEKDRLLRRYWTVPERQIEASVVLADERWFARNQDRDS